MMTMTFRLLLPKGSCLQSLSSLRLKLRPSHLHSTSIPVTLLGMAVASTALFLLLSLQLFTTGCVLTHCYHLQVDQLYSHHRSLHGYGSAELAAVKEASVAPQYIGFLSRVWGSSGHDNLKFKSIQPSDSVVLDEAGDVLRAVYDAALAVASSTITGGQMGNVHSSGIGIRSIGRSSETTTAAQVAAASSEPSVSALEPFDGPVAPPSQVAEVAAFVASGCRATSAPGMRLRGRRFLMLAQTWEQLSQTRLHVLEAMALAKLTHRTLVLTHVGKSTLVYREALPFCTYFDTDLLGEAVPWVTQDWLEGEMRREGYNLTTHSLLMVHAGMPCDGSWVHYDRAGSIFTRDVDEEGRRRVDCLFIPVNGSTRRTREELLLGAANRRDVRGAELLLLHRKTHRYYLGLDKMQVRGV